MSAFANDAGFASLGAPVSSDLAVADSSIVRLEGPLVWTTRSAPPPAKTTSRAAPAAPRGGGQLRGLTIRNVRAAAPYCLVVGGDGPRVLITAHPQAEATMPSPPSLPAAPLVATPALNLSDPSANAAVAAGGMSGAGGAGDTTPRAASQGAFLSFELQQHCPRDTPFTPSSTPLLLTSPFEQLLLPLLHCA